MPTFPVDVLNQALVLLGEPQVTKSVYSVTAGTEASGIVTLTLGTHLFAVGNTFYVSGSSVSAWNGYQTVTAVTPTTISFANTTSGTISSATVTALFPLDGRKASTSFNAVWQQSILAYTLALAPWKDLIQRTVLSAPSLTVTAGTESSGTIALTVGTHNLEVGQTIYLTGTVTSGGTWDGTYLLTAVTPTTISFAAGLSGTWTSGGTVTWAPLMDWSYIFTLPPDCLRVLAINKFTVSNYYEYTFGGMWSLIGTTMPPFAVESGTLLLNESLCDLKYMSWDYQFFTPPQYPDLINLLALKTAAVLSFPITRDSNLLKLTEGNFQREFIRQKLINSQQGTPEQFQESEWITSRM
ncbi:MAG: hypothetical protein ACYDB1_01195 [Acidiferrobacteraceae bacterium]